MTTKKRFFDCKNREIYLKKSGNKYQVVKPSTGYVSSAYDDDKKLKKALDYQINSSQNHADTPGFEQNQVKPAKKEKNGSDKVPITSLKYVGPAVAQKLIASGLDTVEKILAASAEQLSKAGLTGAQVHNIKTHN